MSNATLTRRHILSTLTPVCDRKEGVGGFTDPATGAWVSCITTGADARPMIGDGMGKMYLMSDYMAAIKEGNRRHYDAIVAAIVELEGPSAVQSREVGRLGEVSVRVTPSGMVERVLVVLTLTSQGVDEGVNDSGMFLDISESPEVRARKLIEYARNKIVT